MPVSYVSLSSHASPLSPCFPTLPHSPPTLPHSPPLFPTPPLSSHASPLPIVCTALRVLRPWNRRWIWSTLAMENLHTGPTKGECVIQLVYTYSVAVPLSMCLQYNTYMYVKCTVLVCVLIHLLSCHCLPPLFQCRCGTVHWAVWQVQHCVCGQCG